MSKGLIITLSILGGLLLVVFLIISWGVGVNNKLVALDEGVKSAWSQVENQYQRRYDLIPNLVETVKGFAKQEKEVLVGVTEARASVGQMKVTPEVLNNPQAFQNFQKAQDGLSSALSRLMVVVEKYPELKSNENFLQLQSQLEGTENRISVERRNFNETAKEYNTKVRIFPESIIASFRGFREAQYFESVEGSEKAPQVKF